jgi:tetratricopeptide (TPR) repeat protein
VKKFLMMFALLALALPMQLAAQEGLPAAEKLLEAKKFDEALAGFEAVLEADSKSFAARVGAAKCLLAMGQGSAANFHAVKAEALKPENLEAIDLVGRSFAAMGNDKIASGGDPTAAFEESLVAYRKAAKLDPKNAVYRGHQGWLLWMLGRSSDAAQAYLEAAKLDSKNVEYPFLAAQRFGDAQDVPQALAAIKIAIKRDAKRADLYAYQGRILEFKKDMPAAAKAYRMVLGLKSLTDESAGEIAGGLYRCRAADQNWKALASDFEIWTKTHPKTELGHWWQGYAQALAADHRGSLASFEKLEKLSQRYRPEALLYQGMALQNLGKAEDAVKVLKKAAAYRDYTWSDDTRRPVFQMRAVMGTYFRRGDFAKAIEVGEKHILPVATRPLDICRVQQDLGFFLRDFGAQMDPSSKAKKAVAAFRKSREYYEKAVAMFDQLGEALPDGEKAQIQNDCGLMYQYYDVREIAKAEGHYEKALEYNPNYDDALLNWGRIKIQQGKFQEAVDLLSRGSGRGDLQAALRQARKRLASK